MKLILTGTTGFIGHSILTECLQNPSITSIIALSRRALPATVTSNPKLTVRIHDDFLTYPDSLLRDLEGAEGCIWALGTNRGDTSTSRRINIEYTMAAIRAFDKYLAPDTPGKKFRFVYISGGMAERDQNRTLWVAGGLRKVRGQVENELIAYERGSEGVEVYIARPAMVLERGWSVRTVVFGLGPSIWVDVLGRVLVDVVVRGADGQRELENERLVRWDCS
ncbi:putative nucleoside-diphosphate-sugar epimerase [Aspergillus ibericus CBS 121593]|uniref:NAD(P)-binding domain-containing protein n=1 Tax=Aspergillus ibericus CBS 121593 TaxID=1448316 RepID=A0A395H8T5_9EURO|nr:hypothetical protein BO80DRAFT_377260 [Aspergillus ibericus CBS 121593]RAL03288.1 hypothetical protein BO80DRAFT_377260 [Aspergillus ibericus CBS 121593]